MEWLIGLHLNSKQLKSIIMKKTKKAGLIAGMLMTAAVFFTAQKVNAQGSTGGIMGTVYEDSTKTLTQIGASVYVMVGDEMVGTTTDVNGKFTIKPLNPGNYNLTVSYLGKSTLVIPVTVKPNMTAFENEILLTDDAKTIPEVVIVAQKHKLIDPEETSVKTITFADIKNNPNLRNPKKLLQTITSDIVVSENGKDAYVRGGRADASVYFLDGVKMDNIGNVPGSAIGSVTVYTGGVPAKYGDTTSGVIIMETKSYMELYNDWYYSQQVK